MSNARRAIVCAASAMVVATVATEVRAQVVIEDFNSSGDSSGALNTPGGTGGGGLFSGIGGELDFRFTFLAGTDFFRYAVGDSPVPGEVLGIDGSSFAQGQFLHQWDGADSSIDLNPAGLGSQDLTATGAADAVLVDVYFNDVPTTLKFDVYSDGGTSMSTATLQVPAQRWSPGRRRRSACRSRHLRATPTSRRSARSS